MAGSRVTRPAATPLSARGDAAEAFASWQTWLATEKRASRHTLDSYSRDIAGFFTLDRKSTRLNSSHRT